MNWNTYPIWEGHICSLFDADQNQCEVHTMIYGLFWIRTPNLTGTLYCTVQMVPLHGLSLWIQSGSGSNFSNGYIQTRSGSEFLSGYKDLLCPCIFGLTLTWLNSSVHFSYATSYFNGSSISIDLSTVTELFNRSWSGCSDGTEARERTEKGAAEWTQHRRWQPAANNAGWGIPQ